MTEEELNATVEGAQKQIAELRESLKPAYATLGEVVYLATCDGDLSGRFADEYAAVAQILEGIAAQEKEIEDAREAFEAEQKRIAEEEAARAAAEAAAAEAAAAEAAAAEEESEGEGAAAEGDSAEPAADTAVEGQSAPTGTRTCPTCGTEIQEGDNFCAGCGGKVSELLAAPVPAKIFCSSCGKELEPEMRFCIYCGTKVQQ